MTKQQKRIVEKILKKNFFDKDIRCIPHEGNRSQIYCIDNKFAVKIFMKDYEKEIIAYEKLNGLSFLPKFYGKDDEMKIIIIEWVDGDFFNDYLKKYKKLPDNFINDFFSIKIEMNKRGCEDYDSKISELCWNENKIRKVDYGQVEYYENCELLKNNLHELYEQKEKLLKNDNNEWNQFCQDVLYLEGVTEDIIIAYRESLK